MRFAFLILGPRFEPERDRAAILDGTDLPLAPCLLGKLTHGLLSALLAAAVSFWLF